MFADSPGDLATQMDDTLDMTSTTMDDQTESLTMIGQSTELAGEIHIGFC